MTLLAIPARRAEVADLLRGDRDFDPRWLSAAKRARSLADTRAAMVEQLRAGGARDEVSVITGTGPLDGHRTQLEDALAHVLGHGPGLVVCVPGRLA